MNSKYVNDNITTVPAQKEKENYLCIGALTIEIYKKVSLDKNSCTMFMSLFTEKIINLSDDFLTKFRKTFTEQKPNEIVVLENIKFYPEEKRKDKAFDTS